MTQEEAAQQIARITKDDPLKHLEIVQGISSLLPYQRQICDMLKRSDRVAIKSCHGSGKTFLAGKLVLWYASMHCPCKGVTTAPTFRQVKDLLWSEIRAGFIGSHLPLGGKMGTIRWDIDPDWFVIGYSPKLEAGTESAYQASTFQGFHSKHMFFVLDEATGVQRQVWDQLEGMTTGGHVKVLAIGNPTSRQSEFYNCFYGPKAAIWDKFSITAFDSPNLVINGLISEQDINTELLILRSMSFDEVQQRLNSYQSPNPWVLTAKWVMERAIEWGINHPLFRAKVLAEFPQEDENSLFTLSAIDSAVSKARVNHTITRRSIGVDPARFGTDKSIVTVIEDNLVVGVHRFINARTTNLTGEIIKICQKYEEANRAEECVIAVDGTGIGAGVVDALVECVNNKVINAHIEECQFGASPAYKFDSNTAQEEDKKHFKNFKAKIFQALSKELGASLFIDPNRVDYEQYQAQLPSINYSFDSHGKLGIESKEQYKKRTGRNSPDESDSLAIANWGRRVYIQSINSGPRITRL